MPRMSHINHLYTLISIRNAHFCNESLVPALGIQLAELRDWPISMLQLEHELIIGEVLQSFPHERFSKVFCLKGHRVP